MLRQKVKWYCKYARLGATTNLLALGVTEITFGSDIEFHAPDKPFINLAEEVEEEIVTPAVQKQAVETITHASKNNAAVYDRNWLLQ